MQKIVNGLLWIFTIVGAAIWVFGYIPHLAFAQEEYLYVWARHSFFFNQTVLSAGGFILFILLFKRRLNWLDIAAAWGLSTIMTWYFGWHVLHRFFADLNIYPNFLRTSPDGRNVVSFQYARVYILIAIAGTFYFSMFQKKFRSMDRVFWAWFFAALCIFMFCMHKVVGRWAFVEYQNEVSAKMERVLKSPGVMKMHACKEEGFECKMLAPGEKYEGSKPKIKNRLWPEVDSSKAIDFQMNLRIVGPLQEKQAGTVLVISENTLKTVRDLRAVAFGGYKYEDGRILTLLDYDQTSKSLDLYLVFFSILMLVFLFVWGVGLYKLRIYHFRRGLE